MPSRAAVATAEPSNADTEAQASEGSVSTETPASCADGVGTLGRPKSPRPWTPRTESWDSAYSSAATSDQSATVEKQQGYKTNIKALVLSALLVSWITIAQVFAAKVAHSEALYVDCVSSGIDVLTYLGNIIVEWKKRDGGDHDRAQLIIVPCSLGFLTYFTIDAARESWGTIQVCRGIAEVGVREGNVNGDITLAFAVGGVVIDALCLVAFYRSNKETGSARHMNMLSAILHVVADCLRATSTLVMSVLILGAGYDSTCLDAYTSLFIGAAITAGACLGFYSWFKMYLRYFGCLPKDIARPAAMA